MEKEIKIDSIKAEAEKIIEDAKAEAEKIITEAKTASISKLPRGMSQDDIDYLNELVEVKYFKDNEKYKDDVFVAINGDSCLIQRGVKVKIKRKFANVLEQSDFQDAQTAKLCDSLADEYQNEVVSKF